MSTEGSSAPMQIDDELREKLKYLVDKYFETNSSPSQIEELCSLMSDDIEAVYFRDTVNGIDNYRQHVTKTLATSDKISNHTIIGIEYDFFINAQDEIVGKVKWNFEMDLIGCMYYCFIITCCCIPLCCNCLCYKTHLEKTGTNTYKFNCDDPKNPKISFVMSEYD